MTVVEFGTKINLEDKEQTIKSKIFISQSSISIGFSIRYRTEAPVLWALAGLM